MSGSITFPPNPTNGQTFSAAGHTWQWNGTAWVPVPLSSSFLPLAGGNLTGPVLSTSTIRAMGVADASNATAGQVGELLSATGTQQVWGGGGGWGQAASLSLTAGDWDVDGSFRAQNLGGNWIQWVTVGVVTTSSAVDPGPPYALTNVSQTSGMSSYGAAAPTTRLSFAATTTVYLNAAVQVVTPGSPPTTGVTIQGWMRARRMR